MFYIYNYVLENVAITEYVYVQYQLCMNAMNREQYLSFNCLRTIEEEERERKKENSVLT